MSHTRVKTTYSVQGNYGATETKTLYCHHSHNTDSVVFYDEDGSVTSMVFEEWESGRNLWDAMLLLYDPFEFDRGDNLQKGVEYYIKGPWEEK